MQEPQCSELEEKPSNLITGFKYSFQGCWQTHRLHAATKTALKQTSPGFCTTATAQWREQRSSSEYTLNWPLLGREPCPRNWSRCHPKVLQVTPGSSPISIWQDLKPILWIAEVSPNYIPPELNIFPPSHTWSCNGLTWHHHLHYRLPAATANRILSALLRCERKQKLSLSAPFVFLFHTSTKRSVLHFPRGAKQFRISTQHIQLFTGILLAKKSIPWFSTRFWLASIH